MAQRPRPLRKRQVPPAMVVIVIVVVLALVVVAYLKFGQPKRGQAKTKEYLQLQAEFQQKLEEFKAQGRVPPIMGRREMTPPPGR